ncbi:hypothetical protein JCM18905_3240 [Vibrio sp. JCM 18905]|nr:hypothetical protein JCM18905_3240 [Vibrio sp. JCM 18905]
MKAFWKHKTATAIQKKALNHKANFFDARKTTLQTKQTNLSARKFALRANK